MASRDTLFLPLYFPTRHTHPTCNAGCICDIINVYSLYSYYLAWGCLDVSRVGDPEKEAYFVRNKNPTVIWILNDQNSSKWSLEEC